jgi:NAD(P)-dependent dehydrogenase (short-subunit alcohol dehydrogenase family)
MAANQTAPGGAVVVTGASTGIGEACALLLDRGGFQIFAGIRKQADAEALKRKASARLTPLFIDVTDAASIAAAAEAVLGAVGEAGLAGLVNNAGIAIAAPLEFIPAVELRRQLDVNVVGQIAVTQAFLPLLRNGRGRIVNMGSIGGLLALPFTGPYNASKFALEALTDSLRMELRPWGIEVSIVEPGGIATPIWDKSAAEGDEMARTFPQRAHDLYGSAMDALRRVAAATGKAGSPPEDVAEAVMHALTAKKPKTRYLVGWDARFRAMLRFLPDRIRDGLILGQLS